jgi:hypothetical protein
MQDLHVHMGTRIATRGGMEQHRFIVEARCRAARGALERRPPWPLPRFAAAAADILRGGWRE